jgi:hypothetical protein
MNKCLLFVLLVCFAFLPILSHSYTVKEMRQDIKTYLSQIQSLKSDFSMSIHGTGKQPGSEQSGKFTYTSGSGTSLEYLTPMKMKVEMRANGDLYVNGDKKPGMTNSYQPGDIFFDYYLANYDLKIDKEDSNYITLIGFEKTSDINKLASRRKMLNIRYAKALKVIDRVNYLGNGNDYPYIMDVKYEVMQGIPVMTVMNMRMAAFSVSVSSVWKMENIELVKK